VIGFHPESENAREVETSSDLFCLPLSKNRRENAIAMLSRRGFLGSLATATGAALMSRKGMAAATANTPAIPKQIKMFDIDLNWLTRHGRNLFAPSVHWANESPTAYVGWYESLGANVIHLNTVSQNGYAGYKHGFAPAQPGLKDDLFPEVVRLAHKKNMLVSGYY
jgi:hypothetical protein